jgi:hypothetical protein
MHNKTALCYIWLSLALLNGHNIANSVIVKNSKIGFVYVAFYLMCVVVSYPVR